MVTLKDIAQRAGVNISSVSKALRDSAEISEQKRNEIKQIAEELNYVPNLAARALAGKGTNSIGIILPEIRSNYYARMMNDIEAELNRTKYTMIMGTTNFDVKKEVQYLNVLCSRSVDGIVIIGSMNCEILKYIDMIRRKYDMPVVMLESFVESEHHDYISIDNRYGISQAIKRFVDTGHTRIGFISETISAKTRLPWFKAVMEEYGLKVENQFVKVGTERFEKGGYELMHQMLSGSERPTAVFASYDDMAIGAIKAVYEHNLSIPQDISIIGFDNIRESEYLLTPLTTVSPPIQEMVNISINLLLKNIQAKQNHVQRVPQHISLKPSLIIRMTG